VVFENREGVGAREVIVPLREDVNDGARSFSRRETKRMIVSRHKAPFDLRERASV
jgi:hypothetical protein